jgi:hypothetical protein
LAFVLMNATIFISFFVSAHICGLIPLRQSVDDCRCVGCQDRLANHFPRLTPSLFWLLDKH